MFIADAHLDLAYNALRGRDVLRPAAEQTPDAEGIPTVGLPDLLAGGVGLICATVFCMPSLNNEPGYRTADEAAAAGAAQLNWYRRQEAEGRMRFVRRAADLPDSGAPQRVPRLARPTVSFPPSTNATSESARLDKPAVALGDVQGDGGRDGPGAGPQAAIQLLEGADPIRTPDDVPAWYDAGMRIVGLAWKQTRYAGGTGAPGPLTPAGIELLPHLDRFGIVHDASHLAEESFWQLLERSSGAVIASHSNCRAIVPTDRQLSDDMIRVIVQRDGVIGINFFDKFLLAPDEYGKRRATLGDVVRHVDHICQLAGDARHVAIGTDMDGGLGRNEIPEEIATSADLPTLAPALAAAGYDAGAVEGIMGRNWLNFFRHALPA